MLYEDKLYILKIDLYEIFLCLFQIHPMENKMPNKIIEIIIKKVSDLNMDFSISTLFG